MNNFFNTIKIFFRSPSLAVSYFVWCILDNIILYRIFSAFIEAQTAQQKVDYMYYFGDMGILCFSLSFFPLAMGYEFVRQSQKKGIEQIAYSCQKINHIKLSQILAISILVLFHLLNVAIYFIIGFLKMGAESYFTKEIVAIYINDYFLLAFASLAIGVLISRVKNKYLGYGGLFVICLTYLPATAEMLTELYQKTGIPIYYIQDFVNLIPPDITASYDPLYGFPTENYRMYTKFFWIALLVCVEVFRYVRKDTRKKYVVRIVNCLLVVGMFYGGIEKGSVLRMTNYAEAALQDTFDYYATHKAKEKETSFSVTSYDMDFTFDNMLEAVVKMQIKQKDVQKEYNFTLYHGYTISDVWNQSNQKMEYIQDGDYVTILNPDKKELNEINIQYKGYSTCFYSNKKACFLPGIFPYYPKPGFVAVTDESKTYIDCDNEPSDFRVKVKGQSMYSNLKKKGEYWEGRCKNVSLIAGYVKTRKEEINVIFYPLNGLSVESAELYANRSMQKTYNSLCDKYAIKDKKMENQDIILIPPSLVFNSVMKSGYICDDYCLINDGVSEYEILQDQVLDMDILSDEISD